MSILVVTGLIIAAEVLIGVAATCALLGRYRARDDDQLPEPTTNDLRGSAIRATGAGRAC